MFPIEYDCVTKVTKPVDYDEEEIKKHKLVCYIVMNSGSIEELNDFFERPNEGMNNNKGQSEGYHNYNILIDEGATINLIPHFLLKKNKKYNTDPRPHNMVLSNYEGKMGHTLGVIHVELIVGSIIRPTVFMVIALTASYNLLLGREWIHL